MNSTTFLDMPKAKKESLLKKVIRAANKEQKELVERHEKNKKENCCTATYC